MTQFLVGIIMLAIAGVLVWFGSRMATEGWEKWRHPNQISVNDKNKEIETKVDEPETINLDEYFRQIKKLHDRFLERDELRKSTNGKSIIFRGVVRDVTKSDALGVGITLSSLDHSLDEIIFAYVDVLSEAAALSLRKGDTIEVRGMVDTSQRAFTSIRTASFRRMIN